MDISSVSAALNMQKDLTATNSAATNADDFKSALTDALNKGDDTKLKEACNQLESYMLSMVFKQVKESMLSNDEDSLIPQGDYMEMFGDTMINTIADEVTKSGGIGLSDQLYRQMQKTYTAQMSQTSVIDDEI